ncbi:MAG: hypothetical protein QXN59_02090, partial [Candidatus Micrarchaeaceae archaeon]
TTGVGSKLFIMAQDMEPGIVNISSFSAFIDGKNSVSGSCTPQVVLDGEYVYCMANLTGTPTTGGLYTGTFYMYANYCAPSSINLYIMYCPSNDNFTFRGNIRIQAEPVPYGIIEQQYPTTGSQFLTVNVINSAAVAAPPGFQQMISFDPSQYAPYERQNLGNIRFFYGNQELYSWCESGCTNTSTSNTIFWVKLPEGIPASSQIELKMYFLPKLADYKDNFAGEAPQLTCPNPALPQTCKTYGEYDNGMKVFDIYSNFGGSSLPQGFGELLNGGSVAVDNELQLIPASAETDVYYNSTVSIPLVADAMVSSDTTSDATVFFSEDNISLTPSSGANIYDGYLGGYAGGTTEAIYKDVGGVYTPLASGASSYYPSVITLGFCGRGDLFALQNYTSQITSADTSFANGSYMPGLSAYNHGSGAQVTYQWFALRDCPPGNVMPQVTIG